MSKAKEFIQKEKVVQAVIIADTFNDEFVPISNTIPHILLPILNKPIIDYTLEFLSLGGIEETFLFCCSHIDAIREHLDKCIKNGDGWTLTMKVNTIVSESCHSFGDCLRDIDAKGFLTTDFVLLDPGTISNVSLLPLLKKHSLTTKSDKGAAMTLILQEASIGHIGRCPQEEYLLAVNSHNRVLFHRRLGKYTNKKISFPLEMFLENSSVSILHNIKDTHIAICSPSVLPLFSDNFDYQTKDDFVKGLLMGEEIMGSTIYCDVLKGSEYGGAVTNWRMYQAISQELKHNWIYPLKMSKRSKKIKSDVVVGEGAKICDSASVQTTILGYNVSVGKNTTVADSIVFSGCKIEDNVVISHSIIGPNSILKSKSKVIGCIIGEGTIIDKDLLVENSLVQSGKPTEFEEGDKLGSKAFKLRINEDEEDEISDLICFRGLKKLHISEENYASDYESEGFTDSDDDRLSHTQTPPPDDTKLFYTEVIDSLTRGIDEKLSCSNLILEINSSRYAYNVTVKEVNFNVVKAILNMSLRQPVGPQYYSQLSSLLSFFAPIFKNYLRNDSAMFDCLQAVQDVSTSNEELKDDKWVMFLLKYLYDKDFVTEDSILGWFSTVDPKTKFYSQVKPFTDWLQEAEEASTSEED